MTWGGESKFYCMNYVNQFKLSDLLVLSEAVVAAVKTRKGLE